MTDTETERLTTDRDETNRQTKQTVAETDRQTDMLPQLVAVSTCNSALVQ